MTSIDAMWDAAAAEQVAICQTDYCAAEHCDLGGGDCLNCRRVRAYPFNNVCGYCGTIYSPRMPRVCSVNYKGN